MLLIGSSKLWETSVSISSLSLLVKEPKHLTFSWSSRSLPNNTAREFTGPLPDISWRARGRRRAAAAKLSQRKTPTSSCKLWSRSSTLYCARQPGGVRKPKPLTAESCALRQRRRLSLPVHSPVAGIYHCASRRRFGVRLNTKEWRGDKDALACSGRPEICLIVITNYSS